MFTQILLRFTRAILPVLHRSSRVIDETILREVTAGYLDSSDFNGKQVGGLIQTHGEKETRDSLQRLIESNQVSAVFGDIHPNPAIKALPAEPVDEQLHKLNTNLYQRAWIYPEAQHLETVVDPADYENRPYELALALGAAQLDYRSFEPSILADYQDDPRYTYQNNDFSGFVSIADEYYESDNMKESDQVLLEHFGFSIDNEGYIYVAVFLRYLHALTPEHQQKWAAREHEGSTDLHPESFRSSILGAFPEYYSLYQAVLRSMRTINELSEMIGRPPLFRRLYDGDERPREFGYLLRPTKKYYDSFIHLLDKMLSDNMDKAFFSPDLELEFKEKRGDGEIIVREKSTLRLLDEFARTVFRPHDIAQVDDMMETFRSIRSQRQRPAHAIKPDEFDKQYVFKQRELMMALHESLLMLASMLAQHPRARRFDFEHYLAETKVWRI